MCMCMCVCVCVCVCGVYVCVFNTENGLSESNTVAYES